MRRDLGILWNDIERDNLFHATYEGLEVLEHRRRIRNVRVRAPMEQAGLRVRVMEGTQQMIGALGAEFLPDDSGQLLLLVSVTDHAFPGIGDEVYYGLPRVLAESALDGALVVPEIERLGAGVLLFDRAEVHPTLSSPVLFQWLAGAVVRLMAADEDIDEVELAELLRVPHRGLEALDTSAGDELAAHDNELVRHRDVEVALGWMRKEEAQAAVDVVNLVDELRQREDADYEPEAVEDRLEALDRSLNSISRDDVESAVAWVAREEEKAADDVARLVDEIAAMEPQSPEIEDGPPASELVETWDKAVQHEPAAELPDPVDTPEEASAGGYHIESVDEVLERLGLAKQEKQAKEEAESFDFNAGDVTLVELHKLSVEDLTSALATAAVEEALAAETPDPTTPAEDEPEIEPFTADLESAPPTAVEDLSDERGETGDVEAPLSMDDDPWGEVELGLEDDAAPDSESQIQDLMALFAAADAKQGTGADPEQLLAEEAMQPEPEEAVEPANQEPIRSQSGVLIAPGDDLAVFNTGVFDDLMQIVSSFREAELDGLPAVEDVVDDSVPLDETEDQQAPPPPNEDDKSASVTAPEAASAPNPNTGQLRMLEVQAQLASGKAAELDAEPLSTDEKQELRSKLGQADPTEAEIEAEVNAAPLTLATPRFDGDAANGGNGAEVSTPSLANQEPRLVFGDDMTEPPITPKMIEDLQRLQAKVQKEETEIYVSRDGEDVPADYSDPFGYPPPLKAKRTPFGDLVFYQCAACGEYGAMKVAIHTYRCYRCEAVIEYRPIRVE